MSASAPVLIIGGTRGTGLLVARRLASSGRSVRVLARDPGDAQSRLPAHIEIVRGDLTRPETLPSAIDGVQAIILTAGCRSGLPARQTTIRATEYDGTRHVIAAAGAAGFGGRLLYMTSSGVILPSLAARALNIYKGNTLIWRRRAEDEIRASGLDYTIIRAGFLLNAKGSVREIVLTQESLPLSLRYRIARADVAEVFVAALDCSSASRTTFEAVWGSGPPGRSITEMLAHLRADRPALAGSPRR